MNMNFDFEELSESSMSDRIKEYLLQFLSFTDNKVDPMPKQTKSDKDISFISTVSTVSDISESPRRQRPVRVNDTLPLPTAQTTQNTQNTHQEISNLDWTFEVFLPMLKVADVNEEVAELLVESAHDHFSCEPLLMDLNFENDENIETVVVGDIHGQFSDLVGIFERFGRPGPKLRYIFNGDIVDRGPRSVACWVLLCALKCAEPGYIYVTRGNHETRTVSMVNSSFASECFASYSTKFYLLCQKVFDELPISYTLNSSIFITHGGLPKNLCLQQLRRMSKDRFHPSFDQSTVMALLWNDPAVMKGYNRNARGPNVFSFGPDITEAFLNKHKLSLLIRSHEYKIFGHQYTHNSKCLTIFSSPDYESLGNAGAVGIVNSKGEVRIEQF